MTHDYTRHGTTTLFAALDVATGKVINHCLPRHRSKEFLAFLKIIDGQVPRDLDIHLVLDNYATHKHPSVRDWLAKPRQRRWHLHFTPTSASWTNLVERWFKELTDKRLRRTSFGSVDELIDTIDEWADLWNEQPRPYVWTRPAEEIIAAVARGRAAPRGPCLSQINDGALKNPTKGQLVVAPGTGSSIGQRTAHASA